MAIVDVVSLGVCVCQAEDGALLEGKQTHACMHMQCLYAHAMPIMNKLG